MKKEMQFKISSALKDIIGRDLINDDFIAIFELVKNSYDAYATKVKISFNDIYSDKPKIVIEDNGKGIAAKDLPLIFERFYRTDASRNSSQGGSGIGLSIVKKIIEDHGGYIWATSKEGEGTCMHFVIRKYQGHE